jgi:phospholipid/cholesterol/gamma-HCH transport system substrate-binding protein
MAKVTQAAKVGLFLVATAGAGYVIYRTVSKEVGGGSSYVVHAFVDDATGLATHSRVTIAGIPVGSIDKISLDYGGAGPGGPGRARIDVRVGKDTVLYKNARLGIKSASLLGENVVVLTPGTDMPPLKDGDEIGTMPNAKSVEDLKEQIGRIADLIQAVAQQLAQSVGTDQGGQNMRAILQNLADATDAMNQTIRENRTLIHETLNNVNTITAQSQPQIEKILENVRVITEDVRVLVAQQEPNGRGGEVRDTIVRLNNASKSLESALVHIDHISERIDKGEGTIGRLTKDETLINEVQGVAEGVNDYVGNISRLQTIVGLRSDYNFLANTIKNYVELRLQPREDKYYLIELINDPRGKTSFTQQDVDTTDPRAPAHYRTITTTTTDAFRFSIMFARRLGPFTGRFGIKESTGGIGLDVHLLQDKFELANDLFGFGEEIQPRYRFWLGYEFIKRLWLLGGADHVFLSSRRDYFIGLQLRFTDDDLKTILPFSGSAAGVSK